MIIYTSTRHAPTLQLCRKPSLTVNRSKLLADGSAAVVISKADFDANQKANLTHNEVITNLFELATAYWVERI